MNPPKSTCPNSELELLPEDWDDEDEEPLDTELDDENWDDDGQYIGDAADLWS